MNFEGGGRRERQFISTVEIYRKCTWWTIRVLYGKRGLAENLQGQ